MRRETRSNEMTKKPAKRNRPRISTTIAGNTQAVIMQVAKDHALSTQGVTLDFIIHDWVAMKRLFGQQVEASALRREQPI